MSVIDICSGKFSFEMRMVNRPALKDVLDFLEQFRVDDGLNSVADDWDHSAVTHDQVIAWIEEARVAAGRPLPHSAAKMNGRSFWF